MESGLNTQHHPRARLGAGGAPWEEKAQTDLRAPSSVQRVPRRDEEGLGTRGWGTGPRECVPTEGRVRWTLGQNSSP